MELDPKDLTEGQRYKLLSGAIHPRPIAFVSSQSPEGHGNLAPFSFFNAVGANPMCVVFSPLTMAEPQGDRDTLRNVAPPEEGGTGEFVVNLAVEAYLRELAMAAEALPHDESEWDLTGLRQVPSVRVAPPRVAASPVAFECRTLQIVRTNPGAPLAGNLVIGEVVYVHVHDAVFDAERFHLDQDALHTLGRLGGTLYARTTDRFPFVRGKAALGEALPFTPTPVVGFPGPVAERGPGTEEDDSDD